MKQKDPTIILHCSTSPIAYEEKQNTEGGSTEKKIFAVEYVTWCSECGAKAEYSLELSNNHPLLMLLNTSLKNSLRQVTPNSEDAIQNSAECRSDPESDQE